MDQTADQLRHELGRERNGLTRDVDRIEEQVKSSFDVKRKIDENPLLAVGLAVAGGFLLGAMVGGKQRRASGAGASWSGPAAGPGIAGAVRAGLTESLRRGAGTSVDDALTTITAALTAVLTDQAKELLDRNLPGFADRYEQVDHPGDSPMSGAGADRQGDSSSYAPSTAGTPSASSSTGAQTPYSPGEPAFSPADATPIGGAAPAGTGRDAGARDPS
jgi:hypothetical protein